MDDDSTEMAGEPPRDPAKERLGELIGGCVLLEKLGEGGMGAVYAGYDPALRRRVAIKMVRGGGSRALGLRLVREAQAIARISHPNVVVVHDAGAVGDEVYLTEELCEGGTLADWLDQPRPLDEILRHLIAAGRGLAAAHAAGLIHRDFKPTNVLFGKDGRVRVSDFGLARADGDVVDEPALSPSALAIEMTGHGYAIGTPAYMAPEQHAGTAIDARADQFAFCVVLYEAVAGVAPYGGHDSETRAAEIEAGRLVPPKRRVPPWLLRVVTRGLAPRPEDRHPSMDALLAELTPPRRRGPWIGAAAGAVVVGIALVAWAPWRQPAVDPCRDAGVAAAWSPSQPAAIAARFAELGPAFADLGAQLGADLDARIGAWRNARIDTCRAHRVTRTQSAEIFDRRMGCLDRQLGELVGASTALAEASADAAAHAGAAVERLPDPAWCGDVERLLALVPPPPPPIAAQVADLRGRLDPYRALLDHRTIDEAAAALPALRAEAAALAYAPLDAELALFAAEVAQRRADFATAETEALAAIAAAERGGDAVIARSARLQLMSALVTAARGDAALTIARVIGSEIEARGSDDERLEYHLVLGRLSVALGDLPGGRAALDRAAAVARALGRPVGEAEALDFLSYIELLLGDHDAALRDARAAVALAEGELGEAHPAVAAPRLQLGDILRTRGDLPAARKEIERAGEILLGAYGDEHQMVAYAAWTLGDLHVEAGDFTAATSAYERALAIATKVMGAEHPDVAECEFRVAGMRKEAGRLAEAATLLDHAIAVHTAYSGRDGFLALRSRAARADVRARAGDATAALTEIDAVVATLRATQGDSDESLIAMLTAIEIARLAGNPTRELAHADEVIAMVGRLGGHASALATAQAARAHIRQPRSIAR